MVTEIQFNIIVDDENTDVKMLLKRTEDIDIYKLQGLLKAVNFVPTWVKNRIDKSLGRLVKPEEASSEAASTSTAEDGEDAVPEMGEGREMPTEE